MSKRSIPARLLTALAAIGSALCAQEPAPASAAPPKPTVYRIQSGDDLHIRAYNLPEIEQAVTVRPDGMVSLLLLGDVEANGKSPNDLAAALSKGYGEHFRNPRITVVVKTFRNRSVFVGGEVNDPKLIPLTGRLNTAGAIFFAGGFKNTAKLQEVVVLRDSGEMGKPLMIRMDMDGVLTKGLPDMLLEPFDIVVVPKSRIAKLNQFVDQYLRQMNPIGFNVGFTYILGGQNLQLQIP
jgi:protein involved in polysaccharide export with SLBB domain